MKEISSEVTYRIKRITRANSKDYVRSLNIYMNNTAASLQTESNQITYWLEHLSTMEACEKLNREFYLFSLYKQDSIIGYSQIMYLRNKKIILIDYMAIEKEQRKMGAFYQFADLLHEFIVANIPGYNYIVTEVGFLSHDKEPSRESQALIRLLKNRGFGVANAIYFQPQLSPFNTESRMQAQILIYSQEMLPEIKKETYLFIVNSLLIDHYLVWYKPFLTKDKMVEYEKEIRKILEKIKNQTPSPVQIEYYNNDFIDNTKAETCKKPSNIKNVALLLLLSGAVISSFIIIIKLTSIELYSLLMVYLFSLIVVLLLYSIYSPKAIKPLHTAIDLIKQFFDKAK